ncbi:MAG: glycosyltransferase [Nitrospirales bacterium]|nr:glycosyltransferase [Nitrospirales bacterium]
MKLRVLMLTYCRPGYTKLSLGRLCDTVPEYGRITVWDNNSGPAMRKVLQDFEGHPRIETIIYNSSNQRLRKPTNQFWYESSDADFLSKVDDDCLVSPGWCETLIQAHNDIPEAGILGCWRFFDEDFDFALASRKIQAFGNHRIMRNCWVEGSGYIAKREVFDHLGGMHRKESFTQWCIRAAARGYVNGWYYPFLFQEHLDDPRGPHSGMRSEEDFRRLRPLSASTFKLKNLNEWVSWLQRDARHLQRSSFNPKDHLGWRARARRKLSRLLRRDLTPGV